MQHATTHQCGSVLFFFSKCHPSVWMDGHISCELYKKNSTPNSSTDSKKRIWPAILAGRNFDRKSLSSEPSIENKVFAIKNLFPIGSTQTIKSSESFDLKSLAGKEHAIGLAMSFFWLICPVAFPPFLLP